MEKQVNTSKQHRRVHMANERTFLAWVRTSLGIMAFGFVVERFGLFMRQMAYLATQANPSEVHRVLPHSEREYSGMIGLFIIGFGILIAVMSLVKYRRNQKQIEKGTYGPSKTLESALAGVLIVIGIILIIYVLHSM